MGALPGQVPSLAHHHRSGWCIILFSLELPAWLLLLWFIGLQFFSGRRSIADVAAQRGGVAYFAHIAASSPACS